MAIDIANIQKGMPLNRNLVDDDEKADGKWWGDEGSKGPWSEGSVKLT